MGLPLIKLNKSVYQSKTNQTLFFKIMEKCIKIEYYADTAHLVDINTVYLDYLQLLITTLDHLAYINIKLCIRDPFKVLF